MGRMGHVGLMGRKMDDASAIRSSDILRIYSICAIIAYELLNSILEQVNSTRN
jgi:hypothetical protein